METVLCFFSVATFALLLFVYLALSRRSLVKNSALVLPGPGGARPFVGHMHLLSQPKPAHIILGDLADIYGPIFMIKMGMHPTVVVSNKETAKDCFTTNDQVFSSRPKSISGEILGYNHAAFGTSPYGPYWRHIRKLATVQILSNHRLEIFRHVRESVMKEAVKQVYYYYYQCVKDDKGTNNKAALVDIKNWFGDVTRKMVFQIVLGKHDHSEEETDRFWEAEGRVVELLSSSPIADSIPFLRWLDIGGIEKAMKKAAKELDQILQDMLEMHKKKIIIGGEFTVQDRNNNFIDMMVSGLETEGNFLDYDADTITKATCMALIFGGQNSTTITLTLTVSLLLNHPDILKKAQNELDTYVGREKLVNESDLKNLRYLKAIILESMRLCPSAPFTLPHESTEDCTVNGYHVPAGTRLLLNIYKLHRDPQAWENPNEFQPERFLKREFNVRGQDFEFLPFGSGRRMCPGSSFAFQVVQLTLAGLLQGFELATPSGEPIIEIADEGIMGSVDVNLILTPRLPSHAYA